MELSLHYLGLVNHSVNKGGVSCLEGNPTKAPERKFETKLRRRLYHLTTTAASLSTSKLKFPKKAKQEQEGSSTNDGSSARNDRIDRTPLTSHWQSGEQWNTVEDDLLTFCT